MYIAWDRGRQRPGDKVWCQQKCLSPHSFVASSVSGRGRQPPADKIFMSTERPYHFTHLLQVSKKSLLSLILYNFFHDLIHVYSPGAGGIQTQGTKFWCQQKPLVTLAAWQPSWSFDQDRLNKLPFPHPMETPYEIWLQSALWFLRRCLKSVDDRRTDNRGLPIQ